MKGTERFRFWIHRGLMLAGRRTMPYKQHSELEFWRAELDRIFDWYEGARDELWGVPAPRDRERVEDGDQARALESWIKTVVPRSYPEHLKVARDRFAGMELLDVGCGPVPYVLGFTECSCVGVDQLVERYRALGFPLDGYSDRLTYVRGSAEEMPLAANSFDAVISVNAIDHVDDFSATAREISRVLRPGGVVRLEAHYHDPTVMEPWRLDDELIQEYLGHLGVRKVHELTVSDLPRIYPGAGRAERLTVWAND